MFDEYKQAEEGGFKGQVLDNYLALGFFRMNDEMFTTQSIADGKYGNSTMMAPVFWLRTVVPKINEKKNVTNLRKKCSGFSIIIKNASKSPEFEELFNLYKEHVTLDLSFINSDSDMLDLKTNPFDSKMIEVRDGTKLIAVGLFDVGKESIMGIRNIYHPDYHKFSLGKYLMLQKIDYVIANKMKYYYTGYISTSSKIFDFKIYPDESSVEVFMPFEKEWRDFSLKHKNDLGLYFEKNVFGDLLN